MTEMPTTPRHALPLLAVAQAQKEITHNEALVLIDALVHAAIEAGPVNDPPPTATAGQCWLVGSAPTGVWAGQARSIAISTAGGGRFAAPRHGIAVRRIADGAAWRFDGAEWVGPPVIAAASGGATVGGEARAVLAELIQLLAAQGLLKSS